MPITMKRLLAAGAAAALVGALALAGCAQAPKAESGQGASSAPATEEKAADAVELQIFAANSLTKAMDEAKELYSQTHPGITFADVQYKSSGELNELLKGGAQADILISASKGKMDDAATAKLIDQQTRFDMFTNDLVMVTSADNSSIASATLEDIAAGKYTVAVGDESVPAGNYACQALSTVGLYAEPDGSTGSKATGTGGTFAGALADPSRVSLQTSVGNVCKQAQSGAVDIAFVYTSDVYRFGGVKVVGTVPADTHKNIIYPAAVTSETAHAKEAGEFLDWCVNDPQAAQIWQKWGFVLAS